MRSLQRDEDDRSNLNGNYPLELLLCRFGKTAHSNRMETVAVKMFKLRGLLEMPTITAVFETAPHMMGVTNMRNQIVPGVDRAAAIGASPIPASML
jgi:two-component system chemotaxis response regulator CheV